MAGSLLCADGGVTVGALARVRSQRSGRRPLRRASPSMRGVVPLGPLVPGASACHVCIHPIGNADRPDTT